MIRKHAFFLAVFVAVAVSGMVAAADEKPSLARRPNILFIMTDQQRWDCVGANGNTIIKTPNLDRLAEQGANFSHAFVASPVCVPSRISFFTGRYAHSHRNRVNYTPLDHSEVLLQARLKEAGYRTASIGKLHYFPPTVEEAKRTGLDIVELHDGASFTDRYSDYVKWRQANDPKSSIANYHTLAKDIAPGRNPFRAAIDAPYTDTAWTGERARHWLEELSHGTQPFFLYVSFWKPHSPYDVAAPYDSMYDGVEIPIPESVTDDDLQTLPLPLQKLATRNGLGVLARPREKVEWAYRSYYGTISHVDREIGLLLDTLAASGQAENTLVVFTSDHGDQLFEHHITDKNCFFEPSVRVPFMVSLPGRIKPARYDQLMETVDLMPTLLEFVGVPEPRECQGRSFAPLIADLGRPYTPHDAVFSENIIPEVITGGNLNLPFEKGKGVDGIRHPDAKMVRTERWKYCYYPEGYAELYDLHADPGERTNLAGRAEVHAVEEDMRTRLLNWLIDSVETDEIAPRWLLPEAKK
ncbi:MAG: sulfatase-like hydrolase/transferase [Chthoniobacter sp.]|uniref:sulfatase family protein n=1 Tax=Chthoniobacter sp. TaxID=2510640 RepID=UPI0032A3BFC6